MIKNSTILLILLSGIFAYSCQEDWDKHYDRDDSLPEQNLYELIKQEKDLSTFAKLIEISGYDSLLSESQTYTVWAPVNEMLINIDMTDRDQARLIVGNHIARFNNSTSTDPKTLIRMINKKVYTYSNNDGLHFGGVQILAHDKLAKNGLLHTIEHAIPYAYNLYEYMAINPNTSKIYEFISSFNETVKVPFGINSSDSTFISDNMLLNYSFGLGRINYEDSIYSMLVPDNNAWDAAYKRISPYFNVYNANKAYADSVKNVQTCLAIVYDLVYRGRIANPASMDSLISTTGSIIHDPADLFLGSSQKFASNGFVYLTSNLRYNNTETWNKKIPVECEYQQGRTVGPNTSISTRAVSPNNPIKGVSNLYYIEVQPTSTTSQPSVTFEIPDVLSGQYNIYIEFVPATIDGDQYANDSTKLLFDLSYMDSNGLITNKTVNSSNFVTSGTKIVRIKAYDAFEFPVSNFYDYMWWMDGSHTWDQVITTTKLMVRTNVSTSEVNNNIFTRRFRVDRIVFEPIRK